MAAKRIQKELKLLATEKSDFYSVEPSSDNIFRWEATIKGPLGSPYEGGIFKLKVLFPPEYPFDPPKMIFLTKVYHPNIDSNGKICVDILGEKWSPVLSVSKILISIGSFLCDPNVSSPLNVSAAVDYDLDRERYDIMARKWTKKYAMSESVK